MSSYDDDDIEFDFFDEPETETVEATQRRRLPRLEMPSSGRGGGGGERPPRPPVRTATGLVPLARLVGLIALAIVVVVALVFWVDSCQGKSKHSEYASYAGKVASIANADKHLGNEFANTLISATSQSALEAKLQQYAQQEQQSFAEAQQIRAPGPLRDLHQRLVDAIELRVKGLAGIGDIFASPNVLKNQTATVARLAAESQLLTSSDVVWEQLYRAPATQQLVHEGVTGVVIPSSVFLSNPDDVSARSYGIIVGHLAGVSSTGGKTGPHGDALVGVRVLPQGTDLSTGTATTVKVSADLAFEATVQDSGNFVETSVPVKLTITVKGVAPITKTKQIPLIQPAQSKTVTFKGFQLPTPAFGNPATVRVDVGPVAHEVNVSNNSASYSVFFTLS